MHEEIRRNEKRILRGGEVRKSRWKGHLKEETMEEVRKIDYVETSI